jgi:CHAD domain-containing protein
LPRAAEYRIFIFAVTNANAGEMNPAVLSLRLLALLEKVSSRTGKEDVHRLRTTLRRLEVQLVNPPRKIAKVLRKLRRKAGKVRDLDVHLGLLKPSLAPPAKGGTSASAGQNAPPDSQIKLRQILREKRDRRRGSLRVLVSQATPWLESRLPDLIERRPQTAVSTNEARQQAGRARRRYLQWTREIPTDEQRLHQLRIRTKKLRYEMESLPGCDEAAELAEKFKQVQDSIGEWHDWLTLEQLAARNLKSEDLESEAGPVLREVHARAVREYRRARRSARTVRNWMAGAPPAAEAKPRLIHKAG